MREITKYTAKPGDNIWKIAKANGLKHWQDLYFDRTNEPLRRQRPNPSMIKAGDIISIPKSIDPSIRRKEIQRLQDIIGRLKRTKGDVDHLFKTLASEETKLAGDLKRKGEAIDTFASILNMLIGLGKMTQAGAKAMATSGDDLAKANKAFLVDFAKDRSLLAVDTAAKLADETIKEPDSVALMVGKSLAKAWSDMWSPTFWAAGYLDIVEKRRWDPTKWNVDSMHQETQRKLQSAWREAHKQLDEKIRKYDQAIAALR